MTFSTAPHDKPRILCNYLKLARTWVLLPTVVAPFLARVSDCQPPASSPPGSPTLARRYQDGESIRYAMKGLNQGHLRTIRYQAAAVGGVKFEGSRGFVEEFSWQNLIVDGHPVDLTPGSKQFRQKLSLSAGYTLSVPALNTVQPILIGPITDLLTFYADGQLAMRQKGLVRTGDHVFFKHGTPNSWADGTYTIFGQDSVDFDMTLSSIDQAAHTATLVVRHIPPAETRLPFPAAWMATPVAGPVNNWAQVEKSSGGKYLAEVGNETFEVTFVLSLSSGRILKASMDNPTEVLERTCDDVALSVCSPPIRYTIRRDVELVAIEEGSEGLPH